MFGDIFGEILDIFVGFFRELGVFFVSILRSPEAWLLLALFVFGVSALVGTLDPDLAFLGIDGLTRYADIQNPEVYNRVLLWTLFYIIDFLLLWFFPWAWPFFLFLAFPKLWWFWLFAFLFPIFRDLFLHLKQEQFKASNKWVLLELRMPRLVPQTPQAMEQVLTAIHTLRNSPGNFEEIYLQGEVTRWFSLELISDGGDVRFFIRCRDQQKNFIEAAFFSYYSDVEITEVTDYVEKLPATVGDAYNENKELFGTEFLLGKEEAYPIKTYPLFETPDPEKRLDPISAFLEVLGKVKPGEFVGIQMIIAPADKSWVKDWADLLAKLKNPGPPPKEGEKALPVVRTPGETEILKAVENNLSKPAFDTIIRFLYVADKDIFADDFVRRGVLSAFNQYGTLEFNTFKNNGGMATKPNKNDFPHVFVKERGEVRKQRMLRLYRTRDIPPKTDWGKRHMSYILNSAFHSKWFRLNIEAIATIFHPPTEFVLTAPHVKRVESRKAGAPAGLAIFGEEELIEKFYPEKK